MLALSSSFTLADCSIVGNCSVSRGAGLYLEQSAFCGRRCTISHNEANDSFSSGGGIFASGHSSSVLLTQCMISDNRAAEFAGVNISGGAYASLSDCIITGNWVDGCRSSGRIELMNCTVSDNRGVGVACSGECRMENCIIRGNWGSWSCGISTSGTPTQIVNCLIYENGWTGNGGGVQSFFSSPLLQQCTIARNLGDGGSAVYSAFAEPEVVDCVIWGNSFPAIGFDIVGDIRICWSDVQGSWEGVGNIDSDPLFVDPEDGDFRLRVGSPCIDSASINGPETDILGTPRPIDIPGVGREGPGAFDMGAYEFQPPIQDPRSDINEDGVVNAMDLLILLQDWQKVTGP